MNRKGENSATGKKFGDKFQQKRTLLMIPSKLKAHCDTRFQQAFTAFICVFKVITLVGSKQRNYFGNANACSNAL